MGKNKKDKRKNADNDLFLNNQVPSKDLSPDQIISLMGVYLSEWQHIDNLLSTQVFQFFYANLIVIILPNIAEFVGITLPEINQKVFHILGMVMALIFLYVGMGHAYRLQAIGETYKKVMSQLKKEEYIRISIKDTKKIRWGFLFSYPTTKIVIITMFLALEFIGAVLIVL